MTFRVYPRPTGFWGRLGQLSGGLEASFGLLGRIESLLNLPALQAVLGPLGDLPHGTPGSAIQLRASHLPAAVTRESQVSQRNCLFQASLEL